MHKRSGIRASESHIQIVKLLYERRLASGSTSHIRSEISIDNSGLSAKHKTRRGPTSALAMQTREPLSSSSSLALIRRERRTRVICVSAVTYPPPHLAKQALAFLFRANVIAYVHKLIKPHSSSLIPRAAARIRSFIPSRYKEDAIINHRPIPALMA